MQVKRDALQAEIVRLERELAAESDKLEKTRAQLAERLATTERELKHQIDVVRAAHEEDVERLGREREKLRVDLETTRDSQLAAARAEKEDAAVKYERERQELLAEVVRVQHERDDSILASEQEKHHICGELSLLLFSSVRVRYLLRIPFTLQLYPYNVLLADVQRCSNRRRRRWPTA